MTVAKRRAAERVAEAKRSLALIEQELTKIGAERERQILVDNDRAAAVADGKIIALKLRAARYTDKIKWLELKIERQRQTLIEINGARMQVSELETHIAALQRGGTADDAIRRGMQEKRRWEAMVADLESNREDI